MTLDDGERGLRLAAALAAGGIGRWDWRIDRDEFVADDILHRLLGHVPGEGTLDARAPIHPDDLGEAGRRLDAHLTGSAATYESEHRLRARDGAWRWVQERGQVTARDAAGRPQRLSGVTLDIGARKRAEEESLGRQREIQTLLDSLPGYAFFKNADSVYVVANQIFADAVGTPKDAIRGRTDHDLFPPEMAAKFRADDRLCMQSGETLYVGEERMIKGGREFVVDTRKVPLRDGSGSVAGLVGFGFDISERRRAEDALRQSEHRLELVLAGAALGMWDWDIAHDRVTVNARSAELLGLDPSEVGGDLAWWTEVLHPDDRAEVSRLMGEMLAGGGLFDGEYRFRYAGGGWRWLNLRGRVTERDAAGRAVRASGTHMDVTERRRAEDALRASEDERARLAEQLRQAQKIESIGMLAGGVAHDFNNLLLPILGFAEMARAAAVDARQAHQLTQIVDAGTRAKDLVRQLLAFSRKQVLEMQSLDLSDEIRRLEPILRRVVREDIRIELELAPDLGWVRGDSSQIQQILMNLVVNAHDAMPGGGRMRIATAVARLGDERDAQLSALPPGEYVVVTVADSGEGMDANVRAHLFEPFFTTKEPGKGTGLGLATVHGIVKQHGGEIAVSTRLGAGSSFAVWLPRADAEPRASSGEMARRADGGDERVLVVEDEKLVRDLVCAVLVECGYRVTCAGDPDEALRLIAGGAEFDLLLTDVIMPGMNGRELHRRITSLRPMLKALYMSGYTGDVLDAHGLGEDTRFLQKPFMVAQLIAKVREVLDG
ncbi:MAG: PAS domain-containing protein [Planctomycetes bacterium]|nr:PAS domain-containing protein [Planctomycetota bacterium]